MATIKITNTDEGVIVERVGNNGNNGNENGNENDNKNEGRDEAAEPVQ